MSDDSDATKPPEEGYKALVENFPNGVLVLFDADLRYVIVGPETLPFSKRKAADMMGRSVDELFPERTIEQLKPELRATIRRGSRSFDIEFDDRIHHIETKGVQIGDEPFGVLITQDVTEDRNAARELQEQNERLDQFASMISHDLKNPLSIATGNLTLYRETGDESRLDDVEGALDRIEKITEDLLTLVQTGPGRTEFESVSIEKTAKSAWDMIDSRSASLEIEDGEVMGNPGQLRALFGNLFRNAVSHGGPEVTVRVGPLSDGFYVEDTGVGIPPEKRDSVFEHGYTTGSTGSGVGLTIVKQIADAHDLKASVEESVAGGARFEFERSV